MLNDIFMKLLFLIVFSLLNLGCSLKGRHEKIRSFNLLMPDSITVFNTKDIPAGRPFVVAYFKPNCTLCQEETEEWLKNMDKMKSVMFYFITQDDFSQMKLFDEYFNISKYPNVVLGRDVDSSFKDYYSPNMAPYIIVFNSKREAKVIYPGGISSKNLISSLNTIDSKKD